MRSEWGVRPAAKPAGVLPAGAAAKGKAPARAVKAAPKKKR
jgi:hypothetical protein